MELEEAIQKLKEDLESTKKANECGLATKGEFNKEIEAIEFVLTHITKQEKMIELMLEEMTDCEFEMNCSNCNCECERDYDQLYSCNREYFEKKAGEV